MNRLKALFLNKQFFHYSWIAVVISALNVFLLWFLIDILHVHTVLASIAVVALTFILRFVLYSVSKVL